MQYQQKEGKSRKDIVRTPFQSNKSQDLRAIPTQAPFFINGALSPSKSAKNSRTSYKENAALRASCLRDQGSGKAAQMAKRIQTCTYEYRCHVSRLCDRCRLHYAKKLEASIRAMVPDIEMGNQIRQLLIDDVLQSLLTDIYRHRNHIARFPDCSRTKKKQTVEKILSTIDKRLRDIAGELRINEARSCISQARALARKKGLMLTDSICVHLAAACKALKDANDHEWRVITLTMAHRGTLEEALETLNASRKKMWSTRLKAPYAGAICFTEFAKEGTNIHLHIIYYGPRIAHADLQAHWQNLTGNYHVHIEGFRFATGLSITKLTRYFMKLAKVNPHMVVDFWASTIGKRLVNRYGSFLQKQIIRGRPEDC